MNPLIPVGLRVEYLEDPLGIDETRPRLEWRLEADGRGRRQTAYRIQVASTRAKLEDGEADLWDSGRVESSDTLQVPYEGKALESRMDCWWRVRAWDEAGRESPFSEPARWTMGLLEPGDWHAAWIGTPIPEPQHGDLIPENLDDCAWYIHPDDAEGAPEADKVRYWRREVKLPKGKKVTRMRGLFATGDDCAIHMNGRLLGTGDGRFWAWRRPRRFDVECAERGSLCFTIENSYDAGLAGMIGRIHLDLDDGSSQSVAIDGDWRVNDAPAPGWEQPGFDDSDWPAPKRRAAAGENPYGTFAFLNGEVIPPCPQLRKDFEAPSRPVRATAYITALGLYELYLNGERVGDDAFMPGWTDYRHRVYYRTYDVTHRVQDGANAVGILLGHGWYSGYLGWEVSFRGHYGDDTPWVRAQIEVEYSDGRTETIATDTSWKAAFGPIVGSDIYMGEQYDARREMPGWAEPRFDDSAWVSVIERAEAPSARLQAYPGVPVRAVRELQPIRLLRSPGGAPIFDLGQNMVGRVRLRISGEAGAKATLRFAEMLTEEGDLYIKNLRNARATDEYWLRGAVEETYESHFTFHGFRYVEVSGVGDLPLEAITGVVLHNDMPHTGAFECGSRMVNQLQHNIEWGQRGNYLEVPTDCPQRDERLGWMGDAQVFARTGSFNFDTSAFFTKWMRDVVDAQLESGGFSDVAPRAVLPTGGAPAWADAGIIVPWTMYLAYGDVRLLEQCWPAMERYMAYIHNNNPDLLWKNERGNDFGDWLAMHPDTPKDLIGTAYFAFDAGLMARIADLIGEADRAEWYRGLQGDIRKAFVEAYVGDDGAVAGETQTAYVLALHFDLLPDELRPKALDRLVADIASRGGHLSTGFVGCSYLPFALSDAGRPDVAYDLLLKETFPSWGYSVVNGATTIWERWDGWTYERGWQDPAMNSFNHYAYGSIGEWMYRVAAGIDIDPAEPAHRHIVFRPVPDARLGHVAASYHSPCGLVRSAWQRDETGLRLEVTVPANSRATLHLPVADAAAVRESGVSLEEADGLAVEGQDGGSVRLALGSGQYSFEWPEA